MAESLPPESHLRSTRVKPPRSVTFLSLGVLTIAGFYAVRIGLALLRWQELAQFPGVSPGYIAGVSLLWAVAASGVWWGLRLRKSWAPALTRLAAVLYSGFSWLERWMIAARNEDGLPVNWPFVLVLNLAGILFVFWTLSRRQVKELFGELHE
jgi:hypothetical protein